MPLKSLEMGCHLKVHGPKKDLIQRKNLVSGSQLLICMDSLMSKGSLETAPARCITDPLTYSGPEDLPWVVGSSVLKSIRLFEAGACSKPVVGGKVGIGGGFLPGKSW